METLTTSSTKLFFGGSIEPEDLITFNEEYTQIIPKLFTFLRDNLWKIVEVPAVRIAGDGSIQRKVITGRVMTVNENSFNIVTNQDFSGGIYEVPRKLHVRLDNVLGIVPLMPGCEDMDPFTVSSDENLKEYFNTLEEMRMLMQRCLEMKHAATLWYCYSQKKEVFREGKYRVECEILEVNKSNIKYKHIRTFAQLPGSKKYDYVDLVPREDFDRFIAPDRYLVGFSVLFGESHPNRLHDDYK
jgi:hypothetical protein